MNKKINKKGMLTVAYSHTLHDIFTSFYAPLIPLLIEKLGFTYALAGVLAVVQKFPSILNPLTGFIADRLIIKWFLIFSPIVSITAMSLLGVAPNIAILVILLLTSGIAAGIFHTTAPVIMRQVSGNKIGTGMSFFMFGGEVARTLGPLIITGAVSIWGLEGSWKLIPIGFVGVVVLYFQLHRLPDIRPGEMTKGKEESISVAIVKISNLFFLIAPMLLFRAFAKTALSTFLPSYLHDDGLTLVQTGMVFAFLEAVAAIATLYSGILSDKIGRKKILVVVMILTPLLMYMFTILSGIPRIVIIAFMGITFFSSTPVFMAMVHDMNSQYPTLANGIFMTINFAMGAIVSLLVGFLGDKLGLHKTYQIAALLSVGAVPFAIAIKDTTK